MLHILSPNNLSYPQDFGSTALDTDVQDSDVDLLVTTKKPLGLFTQERLRAELTTAVGVPVRHVFDHAPRPDLEQCILNEAVPYEHVKYEQVRYEQARYRIVHGYMKGDHDMVRITVIDELPEIERTIRDWLATHD